MPIPATPDELDAAWIEEVLRAGEALPAARVRRITAEEVGVGFGLDGTSVRATLSGDGVPATLVVKWASADNARNEACFYRRVAPRLGIRLATLFAARIDDAAKRGVLVLSDVAPARQGDTFLGATEPESDALTDAMASYHALYWGTPRVPVLATAPRWLGADEVWCTRLADALPRFHAQWADRLPSDALEYAAELPERVTTARDTLAASPKTLVHGDLHLDNVLFLEGGVPVILDWPSAYRGPAAVDFARLLLEGMTSTARHDRQERLLRRYLDALACGGVPYDIDLLRADVMGVATLLYAAAVRWTTGPGATREGVPRVASLCESLVRKCADAVTQPA